MEIRLSINLALKVPCTCGLILWGLRPEQRMLRYQVLHGTALIEMHHSRLSGALRQKRAHLLSTARRLGIGGKLRADGKLLNPTDAARPGLRNHWRAGAEQNTATGR